MQEQVGGFLFFLCGNVIVVYPLCAQTTMHYLLNVFHSRTPLKWVSTVFGVFFQTIYPASTLIYHFVSLFQDLPSVLLLAIEKAATPSEGLEALSTLQAMLVGDAAAQVG